MENQIIVNKSLIGPPSGGQAALQLDLKSKKPRFLLTGRILSGLLGAYFAFYSLNLLIANKHVESFTSLSNADSVLREGDLTSENSPTSSTIYLALETFEALYEELRFLFSAARREFNSIGILSSSESPEIIGDIPIEGGIGGLDHIISLAEFYRESISENKIPLKTSIKTPKDRLAEKKEYFNNLPIGAPTVGEITSEYGKRISPFTNRSSFHSGIDISISEGAPVRASANGKVIYSGRKGGYGKIVHLKHEGNKETLYAHLSKVHVMPGHKVLQGEIIGTVGSTGQSTGPHLHYEIRENGTPINPKPYIEMAKRIRSNQKPKSLFR